VSGISGNHLVIIFRGDGIKVDMGTLANKLFGSYGKAGGRQSMARAEIPLDALGEEHPQQFIWERLQSCKMIPKSYNPTKNKSTQA
jgi:hypothetical protein